MIRRILTVGAVLLTLMALQIGPVGATTDPSAEDARTKAEEILNRSEYVEPQGGPVQRPVRQIERWLERNPTTTTFAPPPETRQPPPSPPPPTPPPVAGLSQIFVVLAIVLAVALAGLIAFLVIQGLRRRDRNRRRDRTKPRQGDRAPIAAAEALDPDIVEIREPDRIEALAAEAETAGDFSRAVRLRFRAGLLRLDALDVLAFDPALTTGQIMRALRNEPFDGLASTFDRVVYGEMPATADDAATARTTWPIVLRTSAPTVPAGSST